MYFVVRLEWEVPPPSGAGELQQVAFVGFTEQARVVAGQDLGKLLTQLERVVGDHVLDLVAAKAEQGDTLRYWLEVRSWTSYEDWLSARQGRPSRTPLTNGPP